MNDFLTVGHYYPPVDDRTTYEPTECPWCACMFDPDIEGTECPRCGGTDNDEEGDRP